MLLRLFLLLGFCLRLLLFWLCRLFVLLGLCLWLLFRLMLLSREGPGSSSHEKVESARCTKNFDWPHCVTSITECSHARNRFRCQRGFERVNGKARKC